MDVSMEISDEELNSHLEDAGITDKNLNRKQKIEVYKVIKSSKHSAGLEGDTFKTNHPSNKTNHPTNKISENAEATPKKEKTSNSHSLKNGDHSQPPERQETKETSNKEKIFSPKTWTSTRKKAASETEQSLVNKSTASNNSVDSVKKIENEFVDVFDCPKDRFKPLPLVNKVPKFNEPFYCESRSNSLTSEMRVQKIMEFHMSVLQRYHEFQKTLPNIAPLGKPIETSGRFNGRLCKKSISYAIEQDFSFEDFEEPQTYTSRTGRLSKKKIYTETEIPSKKRKVESSKKEKDNEDYSPINPEKKTRKKLSNPEILKRSKLFNSKPMSRSEQLFDNLVKDEQVKKESERQIEKFAANLLNDSDDDIVEGTPNKNETLDNFLCNEAKVQEKLFDNEVQNISDDEETSREMARPVRRKVIHPLPGPSGIRRPQKYEEAKQPVESNTNNQKDSIAIYDSPMEPYKEDRKTLGGKRNKPIECPICSAFFSQTEIEMHASSCGLGMKVYDEDIYSSPRIQNGLCQWCDKVFLVNSEYETHVKECTKRK